MSQVAFSLTPLLALAAAHFGVSAQLATELEAALQVEAMPGGMSSRRFFRVSAPGSAKPPQRAVGMFFADAGKSDEGPAGAREDWPFIEIQQLLQAHGVRVPKVYAKDCDAGWLLVEDLGDETLAVSLNRRPHQREALYQQAVADLAKAQASLNELPSNSIVKQRRFSFGLLKWEVEHFREYALEARGISLNANQSARFKVATKHIARQVEALTPGFVHRDYQSRNLMVVPSSGSSSVAPQTSTLEAQAQEIVWIDFQDALLGPRVYDLVALLNDSYQTFTPEFVNARLRDYVAQRGLPQSDLAEVQREFDLCTVQRKLKDAGRFVYFERKSADSSYLPFVNPTIALVRAALTRLRADPVLKDFNALLGEVLPQ